MRIGLVHAVQVAIDPINQAFASAWPDAECMNVLDDRLSVDRAKSADLTDEIYTRIGELATYAANADAALVHRPPEIASFNVALGGYPVFVVAGSDSVLAVRRSTTRACRWTHRTSPAPSCVPSATCVELYACAKPHRVCLYAYSCATLQSMLHPIGFNMKAATSARRSLRNTPVRACVRNTPMRAWRRRGAGSERSEGIAVSPTELAESILSDTL